MRKPVMVPRSSICPRSVTASESSPTSSRLSRRAAASGVSSVGIDGAPGKGDVPGLPPQRFGAPGEKERGPSGSTTIGMRTAAGRNPGGSDRGNPVSKPFPTTAPQDRSRRSRIASALSYNPPHMKIETPRPRAAFPAALVPALLAAAGPALAGDTFFKGGVILHPRDVGFEGRWRVAFGSDYPVNFSETLFAGFEMQTSVYRQDVTAFGPTATVVPINGFGNVKYKSGSLGARPFGGAGLGLVSNLSFVSNETDWANDFG